MTFEEVLSAVAAHQRLRRNEMTMLSGLASEQLRQLRAVWWALPDPERLNLLATLRHRAEEDSMVDFDAVFGMAMSDPNADVRRLAVVASTDEERPDLLQRLLDLCANDPDEMVRAAAAERLAGYAYEAEVGKIEQKDAREIERVLLDRASSEMEATNVRTAALSSVGYFSTDAVRSEVRRALTRSVLKVAAIRAIGRNCDPIWTNTLTEHMGDEDPAIRREAAVAAADYEGAVTALSDLVDDPDRAVQLAAISSLGKIGGPEARDVLVYCYENSDPEIKEAATAALQELEAEEDPLTSLGRGTLEDEDE